MRVGQGPKIFPLLLERVSTPGRRQRSAPGAGNMGDVVQVNAMEDLLHSIAPDQCFWYGHPWKEDARKWGDGPSFGVGQFFGSDSTRVVPLDSESAPTVSFELSSEVHPDARLP